MTVRYKASRMKRDPLKAFVSLRDGLLKRKAALESELSQINLALALEPKASVAAAAVPAARAAADAAPAAVKPAKLAGRGKRAKNSMSLKEAVLAATKSKPLPKLEILKAIAANGYAFTAKNPMNSLNTLLYSDKAFKNHSGKFGPA